jgi:hypothetical protein
MIESCTRSDENVIEAFMPIRHIITSLELVDFAALMDHKGDERFFCQHCEKFCFSVLLFRYAFA